jgi:tetratricopeptide (TPR) repeat protein
LQVTVDPGRAATLSPEQHLKHTLAEATVELAFFPLDTEAYFRRGLADALLERWMDARDDCNRALFLQPHHVSALYLRGLAHERLGQPREAVADFHEAIQWEPERAPSLTVLQTALDLDPHAALASNNLAWEYATGPSERRFLGLARLLAEKAVLLEPHRGIYRNTLGVVYYRLKLWRRALEALQHAGRDQQGANAFDLYFLAMSYQQLGQPTQARECYQQANAWCQAHSGSLGAGSATELAAFRAEVATVLGFLQSP